MPVTITAQLTNPLDVEVECVRDAEYNVFTSDLTVHVRLPFRDQTQTNSNQTEIDLMSNIRTPSLIDIQDVLSQMKKDQTVTVGVTVDGSPSRYQAQTFKIGQIVFDVA